MHCRGDKDQKRKVKKSRFCLPKSCSQSPFQRDTGTGCSCCMSERRCRLLLELLLQHAPQTVQAPQNLTQSRPQPRLRLLTASLQHRPDSTAHMCAADVPPSPQEHPGWKHSAFLGCTPRPPAPHCAHLPLSFPAVKVWWSTTRCHPVIGRNAAWPGFVARLTGDSGEKQVVPTSHTLLPLQSGLRTQTSPSEHLTLT